MVACLKTHRAGLDRNAGVYMEMQPTASAVHTFITQTNNNNDTFQSML